MPVRDPPARMPGMIGIAALLNPGRRGDKHGLARIIGRESDHTGNKSQNHHDRD